MILRRLPFLPAFLEEGGWDVFRVLVFAADAAEDEEADKEGADNDDRCYYCLVSTVRMVVFSRGTEIRLGRLGASYNYRRRLAATR